MAAMLAGGDRENSFRCRIGFVVLVCVAQTPDRAVGHVKKLIAVEAEAHCASACLGEERGFVRATIVVGVVQNPNVAGA